MELYPDLLGISLSIFYITIQYQNRINKYNKSTSQLSLLLKYQKIIMQTQLSKRSKISKYHVIRHSQNNLQKELPPNHNHKTNIFNDSLPTSKYFRTSTITQIYPFATKNLVKTQSSVFQQGEQLFITNDRKQQIQKIPNQTVYKLDNYNSYRQNTIKDLKSQLRDNNTNRMPLISKQKKAPSSDPNISNLSKKQRNLSRWDKKVDKFLYQQSIASEATYNSDLSTRSGKQYFQLHLRDRHKEQMRPVPFVYSIKTNIQPSSNKFIKLVQQIHPQIKIRNKLKIKGINRHRIKTQQDPRDYGREQNQF